MLKTLETRIAIDKKFAKKCRVAIVRTDYHKEYNDNLEKHCVQTLLAHGVPQKRIKMFIVPGSWEIPLMVQEVAKSKKFDAIVAFGVVVKGETLHFEMIASEVGTALMQIGLEYNIPVLLEVLAVLNMDQARARASDDDKNKGIEAATSALKMIAALDQI